MKKVWIFVAAVAIAVGLAGCGSVAAQKPMSVSEAGAYYEKVIKPSNDALDNLDNAYYSGDLTAISAAAKKASEADKTAADKIDAKVWPADAQKYASATAKGLKCEAHEVAALEDADSLDKVDSDMRDMKWDNSSSAALRKVLGLSAAAEVMAPFTVASGSFNAADREGTLTIKNNLKVPAYYVGVEIEELNAQGKSVAEQSADCTVIQPGQTANAPYYLTQDKEASVVKIQPVSVSWSRSQNSSNGDGYFDVEIQAQPINIK